MAPQKSPRNKKHQNEVSIPDGNDDMEPRSSIEESLPLRPQLATQLSETYEKAQEDEREVLKAIYMDDYEESEAKGAWSVSD